MAILDGILEIGKITLGSRTVRGRWEPGSPHVLLDIEAHQGLGRTSLGFVDTYNAQLTLSAGQGRWVSDDVKAILTRAALRWHAVTEPHWQRAQNVSR